MRATLERARAIISSTLKGSMLNDDGSRCSSIWISCQMELAPLAPATCSSSKTKAAAHQASSSQQWRACVRSAKVMSSVRQKSMAIEVVNLTMGTSSRYGRSVTKPSAPAKTPSRHTSEKRTRASPFSSGG
eukprot:7278404-Prymnesium_polylepis.1